MTMRVLPGVALGLAAALAASAACADIQVGVAGPMTGPYATFGEQMRRGAEMAVKDINAAGGVLGEALVLHVGDDRCEPQQAVIVANGMASKGVVFMDGHFCSGSSIPASEVYDEQGILQISPASSNPRFTDRGGWNTHRVVSPDHDQGRVAGAFLARAYAGGRIAVLHDGTAYGAGLAEETRRAMNAAGLKEVLYESYEVGGKDFTPLVSRLKAAGVDAVYVGGLHTEGALILRQMRELGVDARMLAGDGFVTDEFWSMAGDAAEGTLMTFSLDPRNLATARSVVDAFRAGGYEPDGYTLFAYAAMQLYALAANAAGTSDARTVAKILRSGRRFDTVLGPIALDAKGDPADTTFAWYEWKGGSYAEVKDKKQAIAEVAAPPVAEVAEPAEPQSGGQSAAGIEQPLAFKASGKRVALVIGNAAYRHTAPLANPRNDAADTAAALQALGFTVLHENDLDKPGMDRAFGRFAREAQDAEAALFYYAGHAMQFEGVNYLMPVDAALRDEASLPFEMSRLDDVLAGMRGIRGVRIAVLDSCRDNPLEAALKRSASLTRSGAATRGLARVERPEGLLIAYSTQPGQVAEDGRDRNSPFTAAFLGNLPTPGLEVGLLFRRVTADVRRATGGRQTPELSISLEGEFYFRPSP